MDNIEILVQVVRYVGEFVVLSEMLVDAAGFVTVLAGSIFQLTCRITNICGITAIMRATKSVYDMRGLEWCWANSGRKFGIELNGFEVCL